MFSWIEGDGQSPLEEDICISYVDYDGDLGLGDVLVSAMRAAHYLGAKTALSRLETFISEGDVIDTDNCLALLSISDELGTQRLGLSSCIVSLQKLDCLLADPNQRDDSSGMTFKDAISLIDANLPRPYD